LLNPVASDEMCMSDKELRSAYLRCSSLATDAFANIIPESLEYFTGLINATWALLAHALDFSCFRKEIASGYVIKMRQYKS